MAFFEKNEKEESFMVNFFCADLFFRHDHIYNRNHVEHDYYIIKRVGVNMYLLPPTPF